MPFYIQEKRSARGKYTMGNNARPYRTAEEAYAMLDDLDEHGGCGPLRVVDHTLRVIPRPAKHAEDYFDHVAALARQGLNQDGSPRNTTATNNFVKAAHIYAQIVGGGLLDDRREYQVSDLARMYDLDDAEATALYNLIQKGAV